MSNRDNNEALYEIYIFETSQLLNQLETSVLSSEKAYFYSTETINEIFRIMHTIKGSSAMMQLNGIAALAHSMEDMFCFLRENTMQNMDCSVLSDYVLNGVDFIKVELEKLKSNDPCDGDATYLIDQINEYMADIKNGGKKESYKAIVHFEDECGMENIRAYTFIENLKSISDEISSIPDDVLENDDNSNIIRENGFIIFFKTCESQDKISECITQVPLIRSYDLFKTDTENDYINSLGTEINDVNENSNSQQPTISQTQSKQQMASEIQSTSQPSIISVNVGKLNKLMDLVGELVISEAMVTQNPDLKGLELGNFQKAARQLRKISGELQDLVMSIRMVPLASTFHKTNRIIRDMCKKLNKEVELEIIGEETEVDKNIIEHISDPLMHLIRNSIDHGIETKEERELKGKTEPAKVTLEARNAGGDVLVIVKDNGRGLNKSKLLERARQNGLLNKPENEMTEREIFNLIFLPGFSTKDNVTEFSGRGVGMDVVVSNIQSVGGSVSVDSIEDAGSTITMRIPLTLAIIDGMNISVGESKYTIPTISIKESFRPQKGDIIMDPDGNEMIMVRGQCYSIVRLHKLYKARTDITDMLKGILIMVENETKTYCIFADRLIGEQQVVVKALPAYIAKGRKIKGVAGCTLLGDGSISLILDIQGLMLSYEEGKKYEVV